MELTCIMEKEFDLQQYITTGVERFVSSALKATFKNPKESAFLAKFAVSAKKAAAYRKKCEKQGLHIPAFLIASITGSCNLHCEGCYSRDTHATTDEDQKSGEDTGTVLHSPCLQKIISITEAHQNFSKVVRIADEHGDAVVFKNNRPKYKLVNLEKEPDMEITEDEKIDIAAKRIMTRFRPAFEELAK